MLLNVSQVVKSYGPDDILTGATFRLERREKVALVGRNGTGKTTLLKILVGEIEPDGGSVQLARGATIGYLRQHNPVELTGTVRQAAEQAMQLALEVKRRLEYLEERLQNEPTLEELDEYATVHEHYLELEGYAAERDLLTVLSRLGFAGSDLDKPVSALSGGERTRLALARQILEEPDLLILDEPTNHLDLQATEWLESWLQGYTGAVLIVSHDRTFLERVGDRFLELRDGKITNFPGPFEKFIKLRAEAAERQATLAKRQQDQAEKLDEYVRRFMNSQRTAQARGRLKQLEKLEAERVYAPKVDKGMKGALQAGKRSGDIVVSAKKLTMGFENRTLFQDLDWTVQINERWGVIGDNGTGKSTLIRALMGRVPVTDGIAKLGVNVDVGYFSQDAEDLNPDRTPLDFMVWECNLTPQAARDLLGRFLIEGDDVFRPIRTLSGGERNKLSLAKLTQSGANLLVLDEPTNHLDMDSREALAAMLNEYKGTLVLVSHDRWLLAQATNRTLHLRRDGAPAIFGGSYSEYQRSLQRASNAAKPTASANQSQVNAVTLTPREISKEIGRLEREIERLEDQIAAEEAKLAAIEAELSAPKPTTDTIALTHDYPKVKAESERLLGEWTDCHEKLEALRAQQGAD